MHLVCADLLKDEPGKQQLKAVGTISETWYQHNMQHSHHNYRSKKVPMETIPSTNASFTMQNVV